MNDAQPVGAIAEAEAMPPDWLQLAREAYTSSTNYFDASIRRQIESDLRQFQGLHPHGSKYLAESNRSRSRLFRPKTRTAIRKNEAIAAEAFFSTKDTVAVEPQDDNDPKQLASAAIMKELLQHRLTKSIPWFQTVIGAYQDAMTVGTVASYQYWEYNEKKKTDRPAIRLLPIENLRFDAGATWTDPVNTSPYFIELVPMYVKDVLARMEAVNKKTGEAKWLALPKETVLTAIKQYGDSTRLQREQGRTDSKDQQQSISVFSIVWVHKNIIEQDGVDWIYYTLGTTHLLSEPVPLDDLYFHGKRPYVIGSCIIETHKNYSSSLAGLGKDVQAEINDVANLRIDNVKLALNKRYFVKRNKQVDLRSVTRNVPGSVTLMDDPETDVKTVEFNDVTGSSYKEQEVLNLDFDDITGSFSGSSVQSNRKLNETVGGMELLNTGANQVSGYQLRTFVETWVEPVLRQIVLLEQNYETDEVILALAGKKAELMERFNIDMVTDELLEQELSLTVNVGMGATNPKEQVADFTQGMSALRDMLADGTLLKYGLNLEEVITELFGKLGYRDGGRFFNMANEDPAITGMKATIEQLTQQLQQKVDPKLTEAQIRKLDAEIASLQVKDADTKAAAVKKGVESSFSAMQAAEVIAAVPQVAPIADKIMQGAGYQMPTPAGVDPNYPMPATAAASAVPPGGIPGATAGPVPGDTSPNTPATAGTGAAQGIETMGADSTGVPGMANGGMVDDGLTDDERIGISGSRKSTTATNPAPGINANYTNNNDSAFPSIFKTFAGSGGILSNFADGGMIQGPGTGTSDSVPAVNTATGAPMAVSNGEFVVPPKVVQALGADFFQALIAKYHTPVAGQPAPDTSAQPLGMTPGQLVIPADVVAALGPDFFDQLVQKYNV